MITTQDISSIFSEAYASASLADDRDMRLVADLFESVREQLDIEHPYSLWDFIILDKIRFDSGYTMQLLIALRESYFKLFFEKLLTHLNSLFQSDPDSALKLWTRIYADAAVYYRYDLLCMLGLQKQQWGVNDPIPVVSSGLSDFIRENRWVDAFPFYETIAANQELTDEVRAYAEITLLEIILYYYPENSKALKHLENAKELLPDHFITRRAEAIYDLRTFNIQKARNGFLQVISMKPTDYVSFNFMGDCFFAEAKFESAEFWYNEAIQKNILQSETYRRLLFLYGDKSWFKDKEPLMSPLLEKIKKRREVGNVDSLIEKNMATRACFNDLVLYDSYRDVGAAWFAVQNYEKSEEWFVKACELKPGVVAALLDLAYVSQEQKLPKKSLDYFLHALGKDPNHYDVHWGLAFYYQDHGQKDRAINHFLECLRLRPQWGDWVNNFIGNLYYSLKEYKESENYYRKSFDMNKSYPIYRQNLAGAIEAQADQLEALPDQPEAEQLYLAAVRIDSTADRWNKVGNFYYKLTRWKDAAASYEKAIEIKDTDPGIFENRGLAYEKMGEFAEAEQSYLRALELNKESGRYFNRLGVFYFERKLYDKSVDYYQEAINREPQQTVYLENLSLAYEQMNLPELAIPYYEKAIEINPKNAKFFNAIGLNYFSQNRYPEALENYRQAVDLEKNNGVFLTNLGMGLVYSNQKEEAIEVFQKAVKLKDDYYHSWNDLGVLYYEKGNQDKAIECYQKSITLNSGDPVIYSNLALAFNAQGNEKEALAVMDHPLLTDEVRKEVGKLLRQNIPSLFN